MNNLNLVQKHISLDNDVFLDINKREEKIGEITISNDLDCYVVMINAFKEFNIEYENNMDNAIDHLFRLIFSYIQAYSHIDPFKKPVLLLEDANVASKYAVKHDLKKVPRYCGFYLF